MEERVEIENVRDVPEKELETALGVLIEEIEGIEEQLGDPERKPSEDEIERLVAWKDWFQRAERALKIKNRQRDLIEKELRKRRGDPDPDDLEDSQDWGPIRDMTLSEIETELESVRTKINNFNQELSENAHSRKRLNKAKECCVQRLQKLKGARHNEKVKIHKESRRSENKAARSVLYRLTSLVVLPLIESEGLELDEKQLEAVQEAAQLLRMETDLGRDSGS